MQIIGIRETKFKAQDSGAVIEGMTLYVSYEDEKVEGLGCDHIFLTDAKLGSYFPTVGDEIDVRYNKYGKVERVEKIA